MLPCTQRHPQRSRSSNASSESSRETGLSQWCWKIIDESRVPRWDAAQNCAKLPLGIFRSVERRSFGSAVNVEDAGLSRWIVRIGFGRHRLPAVGRLRERILRQLSDVALADELVERGRPLVLVGVELIHRIAHLEKIFAQHRLLRANVRVP